MDKILLFGAANVVELFVCDNAKLLSTGMFAIGEILYNVVSKADLLPYQNAIYHLFFQLWSGTIIYGKGWIIWLDGIIAFLSAIGPEKLGLKINFHEENEK